MTDPFESRLREHLSAVDRAPVIGADTIAAASTRAETRLRRRRGAGVAIASAGLVAVASLVVWSNRPSEVVVSGDDQPSTAPSAPAATGPASGSAPASTNATASIAPALGTWTPIAPDPRGAVYYPSVVWTGSEALVVGGVGAEGAPSPAAAAYDPVNDSWRTLADSPVGSDRINPLVAWTGADMLLIGGDNPDGSLLVSFGEAYDPAADAWRVIASPPVGFISDRSPAAWTGSELLVWPWDGGGSTMEITPIAYDPAADSWRSSPRHRSSGASRRRRCGPVRSGSSGVAPPATRSSTTAPPTTRRPTRGARFPTRRCRHAGCAVCGRAPN